MLKLCPSKKPDRKFPPYPKCRMVHFKCTYSIVAFSCTYLLSWWDCRVSHFVIFLIQRTHDAPLNDKDSNESPFKASHFTLCPSLKCLLGMQVQLLSLWMGKHQILKNFSLSLRLNFIFKITNEIWQQLSHTCCFFCSNSVKKAFFSG